MPDDDFESFEWNEVKSEATLRARGFDFEFAARVFEDDYLADEDRRRDYGEVRYLAIGEVEGFALTIVWTPRGKNRRIIAAWPSSSRERRRYREHCSQA